MPAAPHVCGIMVSTHVLTHAYNPGTREVEAGGSGAQAILIHIVSLNLGCGDPVSKKERKKEKINLTLGIIKCLPGDRASLC